MTAAPLRFGWEMKATSSVWGRRAVPESFGQIGFTGTSLLCEPKKDVVVALLTNRICPGRANGKIDGFRPAFHDGVLAVVG